MSLVGFWHLRFRGSLRHSWWRECCGERWAAWAAAGAAGVLGGHPGGAGVEEAGRVAGVSHQTARQWFLQAGGGVSNGPGRESGRYLTMGEREEIAVGRAAGQSVAVIAAALGRPRCTIFRGPGRNSGGGGGPGPIAPPRTHQPPRRP